MAATIRLIAELTNNAAGPVKVLRSDIEGMGDSAGIAAKGFAGLQAVGAVALTALAAGATAAAGAIASSIEIASEFEDAITILSIAAKGSGESFESMKNAAMAVGNDTALIGVSAAGAAEAMTTLYKAGLTTGEIFGDLNGYLAGNVELSGALRAAVDGAASSELSMAQAADLAAVTLATFGSELTTTEERAQFVNDAMNNFVQAADASMASVSDLYAAMQNVGPTASSFGISLEDLNTALALLSTRGIAGSEAGTALKSMMMNLNRPTNEVKGALQQLNVSLYDAEGNMREFPAILGDIGQALYGVNESMVVAGGRTAEQNKQLDMARRAYTQATDAIYMHTSGMKTLTDTQLKKYTDQQSAANAEIERLSGITGEATMAMSQLTQEQRIHLSTILAGSYGLNAFNVLMKEGTEGWTEMEKAIAAAATIQEVAAARTATFSGAMEALDGVIETIRIGIGSAFLPVLTLIVRVLGDLASEVLPVVVGAFELFGSTLDLLVGGLLSGKPVVDTLVEAFGHLGEQLGMPAEKLEQVSAGLRNFLTAVGNVLGPIANAITSFFSWKDVLAGLAIAIVSALIPALSTAMTFLSPIIAVAAPMVGAFLAVVAAVAVLRNAFETNFLGIRDLALTLWGVVQQVFSGIRDLLSGDVTGAMDTFRNAWETAWTAITGFLSNAGTQIKTGLQNLWQGIVSWFDTGWPKLIAGFEQFGIRVGAALSEWQTYIFNWAGAADWRGVAEKIVTAIGEKLGELKDKIGAKLSEWQQAIFNWAGVEDWRGVAEKVATGVGEKLGEFKDKVSAKLSEWQQAIFTWAGAEDWRDVAEKVTTEVGAYLADLKDNVSEKLDEWQQAIFDWAGEEDWEGVAEKVTTEVGAYLADLKDNVSGKLDEWQQAIFDWAGVEDWESVAEKIATEVGTKLVDVKDEVSAQLGEWQQAIFDWAEAENWVDVAIAIAAGVADTLSEGGEQVAEGAEAWREQLEQWSTREDWVGVAAGIAAGIAGQFSGVAHYLSDELATWRDEIASWADMESWVDVATSIAEQVGQSLADLSNKVTEKLSGWITAFTDWVRETDWEQVGYDLMYKITDAFLDFKEAIFGKLSGWVSDVKTETEGYAWWEIGAYILLEIAKAIAGTVSDWTSVITAWASGIAEAVAASIANFQQIGRDIAAGVAAGISAGIDFIKGAISGVAAATEDHTADAFEVKSPSRLMIPHGRMITAGLAVGITDGVGAIIEAINGIASVTELEAVKSFSEAFKAIGEAIQSSMMTYVLLSGFSGADTGRLEGGLAAISLFMQSLVSVFTEANTFGADALDLVGTFSNTAGDIVDLISSSLLPLKTLSVLDASFFGSSKLMANLEGLKFFLVALIDSFAESTADIGVLGAILEGFAGAAAAVIGLVEDSLRAISLLSGFNFEAAVDGWHLRDQIVVFRNILRTLMREFSEATLDFGYMSEGVQLFMDGAAAVVDLVEDALHAVMLLSGFNFGAAVQGWHLRDQIIAFRDVVRTMVAEFAESSLEFSFMSEAVENFAAAAEATFGMVEGALHAVLLLSGFNFGAAVQGWHLRDQIIVFRNIIRTMIREFAEAAGEFGFMSDAVEGFASAAAAVTDLVEGALKATTLLSEFDFGAVIQGWHLRDQIVLFRNIIRTLVREFEEAAAEFGSMSEAVEGFADAAGAVVELIEDSLNAITILSAFDFSEVINGWHLRDQIVLFRNIIRTLMREFAEAAAEFGAVSEAVENFTSAAQAVVDLIEPAMDAIAQLAGYSSGNDALHASIVNFMNDLLVLVMLLASGFTEAASSLGDALVNAGEFADSAAAVVDIVEPGVEALIALSTYTQASGVSSSVKTFAADLVTVISELVAAFESAGLLANEAVIQAGEMGDALEGIVDVIEPAVEAVVFLVGYTTVSGLSGYVKQFVDDLVIIIRVMVDGLTAAGILADSAVEQAGEMADAIEKLLDVVEPALHPDKGALYLITKYVSGSDLEAKTEKFISDLLAVTTILVDGLTQSALASGVALQKAGQMAESLEALFDAMEPAMDGIKDIAAYASSAAVQKNAKQFMDDLVAVATTLVVGLTSAAATLTAAAVMEAQKFTDSVETIIMSMRMMVYQLSEMGGMPRPDIAAALKYVKDSAAQIVTAFSANYDIGSAVTYAQAFSANLTQLVNEVRLAVAQIAFIAGVKTTDSIQAALNQITSAMKNTVGEFTGAGHALAVAFTSGLTGTIQAGTNMVSAAVMSVLTAAISVGLTTAMKGVAIGVALIAAIVQGIQSMQSKVADALSAAINAAINAAAAAGARAGSMGQSVGVAAASGLLATRGSVEASGLGIGNAMLSGLLRAITGGQSNLINQITATLKATVTAAERALGIRSPSRIFYLIGQMLMAGLRSGVEGSADMVTRAVEAVAHQVSDVMGNSLDLTIPTVQFAGTSFAAPVSVHGVTPSYSAPQPMLTPTTATPWGFSSGEAAGSGTGDNLNFEVNVIFEQGTTASAADVERAVESALEKAMLNSGRRVDSVRRLR